MFTFGSRTNIKSGRSSSRMEGSGEKDVLTEAEVGEMQEIGKEGGQSPET